MGDGSFRRNSSQRGIFPDEKFCGHGTVLWHDFFRVYCVEPKRIRRFIMTLAKHSENFLPGLFDRFFGKDLMDWNWHNFSGPDASLPAANVKETDEEYLIEVAAPGMEKKDFTINFQ